jgi:hypothetical protein
MQKQNGFKMFERDMVNRGKLNNKDYAELAAMGIKKEDSLKYFANLRRKDLSIIPSEQEQEKNKPQSDGKRSKSRKAA